MLRKNIAMLYAVQFANLALPLVSVPFLVRTLGASSYGLLATAVALIAYFTAFTDFGFAVTATRAAAASHRDPTQLGKLFAGVTLTRSAFAAVSILVILIIAHLAPQTDAGSYVYEASAISLVGSAFFPGWLLQGTEEMQALALSNVFARALSVVAILILVRGPQDVILAAVLQAVPLLLATALMLPKTLRLAPPRYWRVRPAELRAMVVESHHAFVSSSTIALYGHGVTLVLAAFAPLATVGFFSAAARMVGAVSSMLWAPIAQGVYPRVASLLSSGERTEAEYLLARIFRALLPALATLTLLIWLLAEPLVRIVLGSGMDAAVPVVRTLAGVPALQILSHFFGVLVLFAHGEFSRVSRFQLMITAASVFWLAPLVFRYGAAGAAWSMFVTEALITMGFIQLCRTQGLFLWTRTT